MLRRVKRVLIAPNGFTSSLCRLQNGELLVNYVARGPNGWAVNLVRSDDGGRTWSETVTVAVGMDDEHDVIELPGGRMLAVYRDWRSPRYGHGASPFWQSHSNDLGRTWTAPTITFQALYGHSPALFRTRRGTLICGYRYVGDPDVRICGVGFSIFDESHNEWGVNHHVVDTPGIGEYRLGCGYPSWDYADDERILCVYHANPTYVASPSHPWPERGFHSDVEGTFYVEED